MSYAPPEALVETQRGHGGEPQRVQKEKRDEEIRPLVHGEVHAVAAVDCQAEFPQAEPGKRGTIAFPHPRVRGVFDVELRGPDKSPPYVAEGFQDCLGVTQRNARAKDHEVWEKPE